MNYLLNILDLMGVTLNNEFDWSQRYLSVLLSIQWTNTAVATN